jgi:hypothetical protein
MVEALKTNTTLRMVALDGVVLSIAELTTSASLTLSKKRLGDASGLVIAHLISRNQSLTQLNLSGNCLSNAVVALFKEIRMLSQLDLSPQLSGCNECTGRICEDYDVDVSNDGLNYVYQSCKCCGTGIYSYVYNGGDVDLTRIRPGAPDYHFFFPTPP